MPFKLHPGPAALYYNVAHARDAGVTMPEKQPASWDELIKIASQLGKESGGRTERFGMSLGLTPVTGLPLPFVSYGGSSMVACWLAVGLLAAAQHGRPARYLR